MSAIWLFVCCSLLFFCGCESTEYGSSGLSADKAILVVDARALSVFMEGGLISYDESSVLWDLNPLNEPIRHKRERRRLRRIYTELDSILKGGFQGALMRNIGSKVILHKNYLGDSSIIFKIVPRGVLDPRIVTEMSERYSVDAILVLEAIDLYGRSDYLYGGRGKKGAPLGDHAQYEIVSSAAVTFRLYNGRDALS